MNRKLIFFIVSVLSVINAYSGNVEISGGNLKTIEVTPEKNTGLNKIYVVYDVKDVQISYTSQSGNQPIWYKYSNLGGGYAEQIFNIEYTSATSTLNNVEGDLGYIIEDGTDRIYFWIVDYINHRLMLKNIYPNEEQDCGMTALTLEGSGEPIKYYTINGQQKTLNQKIEISYLTLEWNEADKQYQQIEKIYNLESFDTSVTMSEAPLCNTTFRISGDCFLKEWNWLQEVESDTYTAKSVEAHTYSEQIKSDNEKSNQIKSADDGSLGGSAPAEITFYAYTSDAVVHNEWQMSTDPYFEEINYRFNEQDLTYTFTEEGTTYLRYIGSNSDGSCEVYSDTYTVNIGASELKCPNAFSPGASEGINDEWKVSYKSIVNFECWIFNRRGIEMCHFTDPESGWDGKYKGKLVKPGVYYYVINAEGADGVQYKLNGDINILRFKNSSSQPDNGNDVITE